MHLNATLVMATLVSAFIFYSSCSKTLLPWTIDSPSEDDRMTVRSYYEKVVSKQPADIQEHLIDHVLEEVRVGHTKNELDVVGNTGIYLHRIASRTHVCIQYHTGVYDFASAKLIIIYLFAHRYSFLRTCVFIWQIREILCQES